jgi:hypothetical protein
VKDLVELPATVLAIVRGVGWRWAFAIVAVTVVIGFPTVLLFCGLATVAFSLEPVRYGEVHIMSLIPAALSLGAGAATIVGAFVGLGTTLATAHRVSVAEAFELVVRRLHRYALVYLPPMVILAVILTEGSSKLWTAWELANLLVVVASFVLFWVRSFGLAPIFLARGEGVLESLRHAHEAGKTHRTLVLATAVVPGFLVAGCVASFFLVVEMSQGPSRFQGPASVSMAALLVVVSILAAPFLAGVLKVAAYRIATRRSVA